MKVCNGCGDEIDTPDGVNHCDNCDKPTPKKRQQARRRRSIMDEVADELGLKKVRGAMGGTYYE